MSERPTGTVKTKKGARSGRGVVVLPAVHQFVPANHSASLSVSQSRHVTSRHVFRAIERDGNGRDQGKVQRLAAPLSLSLSIYLQMDPFPLTIKRVLVGAYPDDDHHHAIVVMI